jgi:hypothetical protein
MARSVSVFFTFGDNDLGLTYLECFDTGPSATAELSLADIEAAFNSTTMGGHIYFDLSQDGG